MTFHIDKDGKSVNRVDLSDDGQAGYRAGVRPAVIWASVPVHEGPWPHPLDEVMAEDGIVRTREQMDEMYRQNTGHVPFAHVDLSAHVRREAIAAHKHAIATAETDAYTKPVEVKGISWSIWAFITAMAMLGIAMAAGVAMVMS